MSAKLKALQERRQQLAAEIRKQGDAFKANQNAWKDDAERQAWDKVNADYNAVMTEIDQERAAVTVAERLTALDEHDQRSTTTPPGREDTRRNERRQRPEVDEETRALALAGFFRSSLDRRPSRRVAEAMRACGLNLMQRELRFVIPATAVMREWQRPFQTRNADHARQQLIGEQRALGTMSMSKGGVLIPGTFIRSLEANMLFYGGIRQVAEQIVTASGDEMTWPTADDTSNEGSQIGEAQTLDEDDEPTFGAQIWRAYKFRSGVIKVDFELLEDSVLDIPVLLGQMMGERLGRITNRRGTLGSGVGTMLGFMTSAAAGKTTTGGSFNFDDVVDLEHSVDPAYRAGASFMCHDSIVAHMRKLKDGNGVNLWQAGANAMELDTLHGRKLTLNQVMDDTVAATKKPLAFGDFSKIKMRRVNQVRMYRLIERYREEDQDGFIALVREDSKTLNAGTNPIKYLLVGA